MRQTNVYRSYYKNSNLGFDPPSQKTTFLNITIKLSLNIQIKNFLQLLVLKTTNHWTFSSKRLSYSVISSNLQKSSTIFTFKFTTSTRADVTFQRVVKHLRVIMMCSTFKREHWHEHSIFNFFWKSVIFRTKCSLWVSARGKILSTSWQKQLSVCSKRVHVSGAQ